MFLLMVFVISAKVVLATQIFLKSCQMIRKLYQQIYKKGIGKRCRTSSYFLYAFWTQIVSKNEPKMVPNVIPQKGMQNELRKYGF